MNVLWPWFLLLLAVVPLLVGAYIWVLRRRRVALRYPSLSLVRVALPRYSRLRRHLPFALFLLALTSLIVALARPVRIVTLASGHATIVLAMDVSGSMRSTDIPPSRLEAAQMAASSFIHSQKATTQIGIIAFADYAELIQPPTSDQDTLQEAVDSLTTGRGTAIGSGILASLDAIASIDHNVAPSVDPSSRGAEPPAVPKGAYAPDIVVLLTDGVSNMGPMPLDAAQEAADRGVRVYTIGFGTANGGGFGGGFGGFFGGGGNQQPGGASQPNGGRFRRGIDETTLKKIASLTGGTYYSASSADELLKVFQHLPTYLITEHEVLELSVVFAGIGALLVALALVLSARWHPLP